MEPYAADLSPRTYRNEDDPDWDPLGAAEKGEASMQTLYVCLNHDPSYHSKQPPTEVRLE